MLNAERIRGIADKLLPKHSGHLYDCYDGADFVCMRFNWRVELFEFLPFLIAMKDCGARNCAVGTFEANIGVQHYHKSRVQLIIEF